MVKVEIHMVSRSKAPCILLPNHSSHLSTSILLTPGTLNNPHIYLNRLTTHLHNFVIQEAILKCNLVCNIQECKVWDRVIQHHQAETCTPSKTPSNLCIKGHQRPLSQVRRVGHHNLLKPGAIGLLGPDNNNKGSWGH